jgi:hypothetical protein
MPRPSRIVPGVLLALGLCSATALADPAVCGPDLVRLLGDHAQHVFAPKSDVIGALVTLPPGQTPAALGLEPFVPGLARLRADPAALVSYALAHPDLHIEVAPPLRPLLDMAGRWIHSVEAHRDLGLDGAGALVGVADTGLDVTLPDFRDPKTGQSRVAWLLDLSLPPIGLYPDVESRFCVKGKNGKCRLGAVLQGKDIDALIKAGSSNDIPIDEYGHGTHVTSIAAGNGGPAGKYVGAAPGAQIVFARVVETRHDPNYAIQNDDIMTGISFLFDRADAMKLPISVNLSIGSDFGPHDGSLSWEKALASFVGDAFPGRALSVAAGNSGSIALTPIHQTVHVTSGQVMSVPIPTPGSSSGTVFVWVTFTTGTSLSVGLDGPDGTWIAPVPNGQQGSKSTAAYAASIANGSTATQISGAAIPSSSNGAVVVWDANGPPGWPSGTYAITFEGEGTADLWLESTEVTWPDGANVGFSYGVREGTIGLPATQPGLIAVGCTVNRASWTSIDDAGLVTGSPDLDPAGGLVVDGEAPTRLGEACDFSGAGPTVTGVPKPEISAPGSWVIAALSSEATPGSLESIFSIDCPLSPKGSFDPRCLQVDKDHAAQEGTSMSAPMVTGAIALLLEREPKLTQTEIVPILQGGAHYFRSFSLGSVEFEDQGGPGELDILGSLAVMNLMKDPVLMLPSPSKSWLTLSTDYVLADGSTPTVAILELRTAEGAYADLFQAARLQPVVTVDGTPLDPLPTLTKRGPGVWFYSVQPPPGLGGQSITFGATFDGEDIVRRRSVPIATDPWTASYPSPAGGSCGVGPAHVEGGPSSPWGRWAACFGVTAAFALARRRFKDPRQPRS